MIVYTGYPHADFVWRCWAKGPAYGDLIGCNLGEPSWVLPLRDQTATDGELVTHEGLTRVEITGYGIDGEGVFHGQRPKQVADHDWTDLFGPSPVIYSPAKVLEPKDRILRTKANIEQKLLSLVMKFWRAGGYFTDSQDVIEQRALGDLQPIIKEFFA